MTSEGRVHSALCPDGTDRCDDCGAAWHESIGCGLCGQAVDVHSDGRKFPHDDPASGKRCAGSNAVWLYPMPLAGHEVFRW